MELLLQRRLHIWAPCIYNAAHGAADTRATVNAVAKRKPQAHTPKMGT